MLLALLRLVTIASPPQLLPHRHHHYYYNYYSTTTTTTTSSSSSSSTNTTTTTTSNTRPSHTNTTVYSFRRGDGTDGAIRSVAVDDATTLLSTDPLFFNLFLRFFYYIEQLFSLYLLLLHLLLWRELVYSRDAQE
ncbi:hypothetical protein M0804_004407 [Polistes exclamans]|nr:hypothetical protein M0804_004407 [Polistes exclamans]